MTSIKNYIKYFAILYVMKLSELKEQFKLLQEKYSLPEFDMLDKEFEIKDITNENIILREIRDRILEKFDEYIKILEGIVQPEASLANMYETKVFNDEEKNDIFQLYKRFMYMDRFSLQTEIEDGDEKVAEFINVSFKEWMTLKPRILEIIIKLKDSWTTEEDENFYVSYCG